MVVSGKFDSMSLSLDGKLKITFSVTEKEKALREVEEIKDVEKFADLRATAQALEVLKDKFRYTEILSAEGESYIVRCYFGSSTYNTKEMSDLIHGTVSDAGSLGIDTITPEEMEKMLAIWKGSSNMKDY